MTLYFGSWDHRLYALKLRGKKRPRVRWTFEADDQIVAAPAYSKGTIFVTTSNGSVYGIHARSGRLRWHATSFSRFPLLVCIPMDIHWPASFSSKWPDTR